MATKEVELFLNHLSQMSGLKRVQRVHRVPVVLSINKERSALSYMHGTTLLMAQLIYGAGLRVSECVGLRVKDIDFDLKMLSVRDGKGGQRQDHAAARTVNQTFEKSFT